LQAAGVDTQLECRFGCPILNFRPVAEQQLDSAGIGGCGSFNQRRRFGGWMRVGIRIRAVLQQQLDHRDIAWPAGSDHQRRAHVAGARVNLGAVLQKQMDFLQIGGGPHQGGGVDIIPFVHVRAEFQQALEGGDARIERCVHEWSGTLRPTGIQ